MSHYPSSQGLEPLAGDHRFDVQPLRTGQNKGKGGSASALAAGALASPISAPANAAPTAAPRVSVIRRGFIMGSNLMLWPGLHQTSTIELNST
jgi:hypothetical protein